jgi:hypothetical protein
MEQDLIVFRAFNTKKQQPVTCRPLQDRSGRLYTGQGKQGYYETLTKEEKESLSYIVTPETKVVLSDGLVLDLKDPQHAANWKWLQKHPYLVLDKEKKSSSRDAVYYVENRKKEATARVTTSKLRDKARYLVQFELSLEKLRYVARVLGNSNPDSFTEDEVKDWLLQLCETVPEAIINATNPALSQASDATVLFNELKKWQVIGKQKGGVYKYGGEHGVFLGHTDDKAIEYIMNPANEQNVAAMKAALQTKTQTNQA